MLRDFHENIRSSILSLLEQIHRLFFQFLPVKQFRYAACGGGNTALNIFIYFVAYNFVLQKKILYLAGIAISPHIAAFLIAFAITFPIGFYLNLFVVFEGSYLKRRFQLFRYFMVALLGIGLNYVFLKLFVEQFGWFPTPSAILTTMIVTVFSYFLQQYYSFKRTPLPVRAR
jgi:putative flippase GtrA